MLPASKEKDYKWLFPTPGIDEFNQMVDEAENSPTITYDEFKKEINEWLENTYKYTSNTTSFLTRNPHSQCVLPNSNLQATCTEENSHFQHPLSVCILLV